MSQFHTPVLQTEVVEALDVKPAKKYIDGTIGGGGHTEILINAGCNVLGLDVDENALKETAEKLGLKQASSEEDPFFTLYAQGPQLTLVKSNFRHLVEVANKYGFTGADGVLFDLGVSSHQLDTADYGLSFQQDAPLDMRLDKSLAVTAETLINQFPVSDLAKVFAQYGDEPHSLRIAQEIGRQRDKGPISRTTQLAALIAKVSPRTGKIHPATKVFQALRIVINAELISLEKGLEAAASVLAKNGKLAVISFHSLEDRIVKKHMQHSTVLELLTPTPIIPTEDEVIQNPRSRSAKLRIAIKL